MQDDLLGFPLMLTSGGVPNGTCWTFFTPEGSLDVDFGIAHPEPLLSRLDGTLTGAEIVAALKQAQYDSLIDALFTLIDLRVVTPTPRLYESYYEFCETWFDHRPENKSWMPTTAAVHLDPATENLLPRLAPLLNARRSAREFSGGPIESQRLLALLWAMYGRTPRAVTQRVGTVPSPGGFYPLDLCVLVLTPSPELSRGLYLWHPPSGDLLTTDNGDDDISEEVILAGLPPSLRDLAPSAMVAIVGNVRPVSRKYGTRALKFLQLEAGHCMQNAHLAAVELGLGVVQIGGYDLSKIGNPLGLSPDRLYVAAALIGEPRAF